MKDFYSLFVDLSLQLCKKDDYGDKVKVRKNNAAASKLIKLQKKMRQNIDEELLDALLHHEDERVKENAASFCLKINILVEQAILTLENLRDSSDDWSISFSSKMVLQLYKDGTLFLP